MTDFEHPATHPATEAVDAEGRPDLEGCVLYVAIGPKDQVGTSLVLPRGRAIVGSDDNADLVIRHRTVSRHHIELSVRTDGIAVRDLGSTNGTVYLGQRVESAILQVGTRLYLGRCAIDLLPLTTSAAIPLARVDHYGELLGASPAMRRLYTLLRRLEQSEAPVLIRGETGTGKELVARAIHQRSPRKKGPFVVIDCANMQADLMRGELFGYRKGSFTGADSDRAGAFESATGGTIFLDEIGELPLDLQPRLLRVLETKEVHRIGESDPRPIDVRVLAATHRDLKGQAAGGSFRSDLYYRIAVVTLESPPLRERSEDVPMLAEALARQLAPGRTGRLAESVRNRLTHHDWPGNVRELRNAVHRLLSVGTLELGDEVLIVDPAEMWSDEDEPQPTEPRGDDPGWQMRPVELIPFREARDAVLAEFEAAYLEALMRDAQGNLSAAAKTAEIDRRYLRDLLKKHDLYRTDDGD